MFGKVSTLALTASLLLVASQPSLALADGMPFDEPAPKPILTPLDQALKEIDGRTKQEAAPLSITEDDKAQEVPEVKTEKPQIEQDAPPSLKAAEEKLKKQKIEPVPDSRIVDVQPNSSFFGLSVGLYDAFTHSEAATALNLEWQPGVKIAGFLKPIFGAMVTTDGTVYGYTGLGVPFEITKNVFVMPSAAVGFYEEGDGYDLDSSVAYRVGAELAYQFENKSRLGLNAHVITNGDSLDKADRTEVISIVYTTPLDSFLKPSSSAKR